MDRWLLAVLLLAGAASAAPPPVAPAGSEGQLISDPGDPLSRATIPEEMTVSTAPVMGTTPGESQRAEAASATQQNVAPPPSTPPPPVPEERVETENALEAPETGRLIRGRGGHDHVERPGGGLLIDGEGRRLEIVPVKNRLVEPPPQKRHSDELDGVLARLRLVTAAGGSLSLILIAWLWRRKDA